MLNSMQSSAEAHVSYEAFDKSSITDAQTLLSSQDLRHREKNPLEMCAMHLPHAGSDGSIASKLPFSTVAICRNDTVGVVRLVGFFDILVPHATRLLFSKAGKLQRALMLTVRFS
jgi:hypothetical protein